MLFRFFVHNLRISPFTNFKCAYKMFSSPVGCIIIDNCLTVYGLNSSSDCCRFVNRKVQNKGTNIFWKLATFSMKIGQTFWKLSQHRWKPASEFAIFNCSYTRYYHKRLKQTLIQLDYAVAWIIQRCIELLC